MTGPRELVSERHLADYFQILRKHRWLITGIFLVSVITVSVWTFRQIPIYQAAATILIDPEAPKILNIQEVTPMGASAAGACPGRPPAAARGAGGARRCPPSANADAKQSSRAASSAV